MIFFFFYRSFDYFRVKLELAFFYITYVTNKEKEKKNEQKLKQFFY